MNVWTQQQIVDTLVGTAKLTLQQEGAMRSMAALQHRDGEQLGCVMWAPMANHETGVRRAIGRLARSLGCDSVYGCADAIIATHDLDDVISDEIVRPRDRADAVDCIVVSHARAGSDVVTAWLVEYGRSDDGTLDFDEQRTMDEPMTGAIADAWTAGLNEACSASFREAFKRVALASPHPVSWASTSDRGSQLAAELQRQR